MIRARSCSTGPALLDCSSVSCFRDRSRRVIFAVRSVVPARSVLGPPCCHNRSHSFAKPKNRDIGKPSSKKRSCIANPCGGHDTGKLGAYSDRSRPSRGDRVAVILGLPGDPMISALIRQPWAPLQLGTLRGRTNPCLDSVNVRRDDPSQRRRRTKSSHGRRAFSSKDHIPRPVTVAPHLSSSKAIHLGLETKKPHQRPEGMVRHRRPLVKGAEFPQKSPVCSPRGAERAEHRPDHPAVASEMIAFMILCMQSLSSQVGSIYFAAWFWNPSVGSSTLPRTLGVCSISALALSFVRMSG